MANPISNIVFTSIMNKLADKAPEIAKELNPMRWFATVQKQLSDYEIARRSIEAQLEYDKQKMNNELVALQIRREAYLQSLEMQRKIIKTTYSPNISYFKNAKMTISKYFEELSGYRKELLKSELDIEDKKLLFEFHKDISDKINDLFTKQIDVLKENNRNMQETLNKVLVTSHPNNLSIKG